MLLLNDSWSSLVEGFIPALLMLLVVIRVARRDLRGETPPLRSDSTGLLMPAGLIVPAMLLFPSSCSPILLQFAVSAVDGESISSDFMVVIKHQFVRLMPERAIWILFEAGLLYVVH